MCGICGYVGTNQPELLKAMCDAMVYRGPDDEGQWHDAQAGVGLGNRRLSIIDLSPAGHQPMPNADGSIWMSYNGEIYNFPEHREYLVKKGYKFRGHSDSEVLLYLYEEFGLDFLDKLNGIFALAIWDSRTRELILARDHAGIKPLYYWRHGERLYFASEIKALLLIPEFKREINEGAISLYLTFLWVPGDETMLKSVQKLEPGHCLVWKDGRVRLKQWFTLDYSPDESIRGEEWVERVRETFLRTTRRQMVSDAPLGAFLSGGLDSSSIVAGMRQSFPEREINCYTIACKGDEIDREGFADDYPYAKRVADHLNITLKRRTVTKKILDYLPKTVYHLDEPDADPAALLTYIISEMAHEDGIKVLLSGTGGDEVFMGYRSHQAYRYYQRLRMVPDFFTVPLLSAAKWIAAIFQGPQGAIVRRCEKFNRGLVQHGLQRHMALVDWSSPEERLRIVERGVGAALVTESNAPPCMQKYFDSFVGKGEINRHSHILLNTFLAAHNFLYMDKMTMAASIEARVPFMDIELLRLGARIPEAQKCKGSSIKPMLGNAMRAFLPREVIGRSKTGFGVPLRQWIISSHNNFAVECLSTQCIRKRGIFRPEIIRSIVQENNENKADHTYLIYALLSLELWQQTFIDNPGIEVIV